MNRNTLTFFAKFSLTLLILGLISGCSSGQNENDQAAIPVANITSPEMNSTLITNQEVLITFNAADVNGIAQVELSIDGEAVMVETVSPPVNAYTSSHRWRPERVGSHVIELRAFNVEQTASDPSQVFVVVVAETGGVVEPTATVTVAAEVAVEPTLPAASGETPTPTAVVFTPTPAPTDTPAGSVDDQARVTALVGLNVRSGPGLNYPTIGRLAVNESANITGRDSFTGWWQIEFSSDAGDRGWIAAGAEFSTAENTADVPVVQAPPQEEAPAPEPTPTPTATAGSSLRPTIFSFTADRYTIAAGERVTLRWDLENAQAAFLRYDGTEEGIVSPGSKEVSPDADTKYILVARNEAGETVAELSIDVSGSTPTPVAVFRDGKIRIANGQSLDFDNGIVQAETDSDTDFIWDGGAQKFTPQGGASGSMLGEDFGNISIQDCINTRYDQPIEGIDGSSQVTGCYITGEGRYGKFFVSEWDLNATLTVEWLTWNYDG